MAPPRTPTKAGTPKLAPKASGIRQLYLIVYNLSSALSWAYILGLLALRMLVGLQGVDYAKTDAQGVAARVLDLAGGSFAELGTVVKWVQTAALLEVAHVLLGLVRSSFVTTAMQVASRVTMVWYVCDQYPQVAASPFYASMVFAWSLTEVVRYSHYATGLLAIKVDALEYLRYSTFYLLYPIGAGSEAALIYLSAAHAESRAGALGAYATYALLSAWPPALAMMMTYMHAQRSKHVRVRPVKATSAPIMASSTTPGVANPVVKKVATTPAARSTPSKAAAISPLDNTPARSTRSKSKAL